MDTAQSERPFYRYVIKKRGREHAAFHFARDAEEYVNSEVATRCLGKTGVYEPGDYTIEDAHSGRRVVGTNGHGHAILESLRRAEAEKRGAS